MVVPGWSYECVYVCMCVRVCTCACVCERNRDSNTLLFLRGLIKNTPCTLLSASVVVVSFQVQTTTMCISVSLSGSVVLGCLFAPKVHIILFQPQKNVASLRVTANRFSATVSASASASASAPSSSYSKGTQAASAAGTNGCKTCGTNNSFWVFFFSLLLVCNRAAEEGNFRKSLFFPGLLHIRLKTLRLSNYNPVITFLVACDKSQPYLEPINKLAISQH